MFQQHSIRSCCPNRVGHLQPIDPKQYERQTEDMKFSNPITISVEVKELDLSSCSDSDSEERIDCQGHDNKVFSAADLLFPRPPVVAHTTSNSTNIQTLKNKQRLLHKPAISSLLSPDYTCHNPDNFSEDVPPRLRSPYHGMSRSCLEHQKSLWAARYEDWDAWHAHQVEDGLTAGAYGGLYVESSDMRNAPRWGTPKLERDIPVFYSGLRELDNLHQNAHIYPRLGDISTLRDPYFTLVDKCFSTISLSIVQRALFLFDMEFRASSSEKKRKLSRQDPCADPSDHLMCSLAPSCFEDISLHGSNFGSSSSNASNNTSSSYDPFGSCKAPDENYFIVSSISTGFAGTSYPSTSIPEASRSRFVAPNSWEISWRVRWQVLGELVRREDPERYEILTDCLMSYLRSLSAADESSIETLYPDDDDEDDYGTVIYTTSFSQHPSGFRGDEQPNAVCSNEACSE
jgi:hypothetical protein